MLAYNFTCRKCGTVFMDSDKNKVRMFGSLHRKDGCPLVEYKKGHWCRRDSLAETVANDVERARRKVERDARKAQKAHSDNIGISEEALWGGVITEGKWQEPTDSKYYDRGVEEPLERVQGERSP